MGSLINKIAGLSAVTYGINILEASPPGGVSGAGSTVVGVVADLPWGPVNTATDIGSPGDLFSTFCPPEFGANDDYTALRAFLNKSFPGGLKVVRIAATSAATASFTFVDDDPAASVDVTAKYPGLLGNSISVAWAANADVATSRDATVTIGSAYSKTYLAVATNAGGLTVVDPGDPFVTFTKNGAGDEVPAAIAATALAGGLDGTAVAADYTGSAPDGKGIAAFHGASVNADVLFVAECPTALIAGVNAALHTYATTIDKGIVVLCSTPAQAAATAITDVASFRDDREVYPWPRVKTTNFYASTAPEITVDGNAFLAVAIASVDPENSPGGASGAPFLKGITALADETTSKAGYKTLNDAGVAPFFMSDALGGAIVHRGVTTSLTAGVTKIFRRRMTDFITDSIAAFLEQYVELPLDLTLSPPTLGPVTGPEFGSVQQFLEDLKVSSRIQNYSADAFGGNSQAGLDAGTWVILISVKLYSQQEEIILKATIGESVTIEAA